MRIQKLEEEILVLQADSSLCEDASSPVLAELEAAIDGGCRRVAVDCSHLAYITSLGIGALVRLHQRLSRHGGRLKLACVDPRVLEVLRLSELESFFDPQPDLEAARRALVAG